MIESGVTFDYAQLVMDDEIARMVKHVVGGIRVDDEALAEEVDLALVAEALRGAGDVAALQPAAELHGDGIAGLLRQVLDDDDRRVGAGAHDAGVKSPLSDIFNITSFQLITFIQYFFIST